MKGTMKKLWVFMLTLGMIITCIPYQATKAAEQEVDMSKPYIYGKSNSVTECTYDTVNKTLTATNVEQFQL